MNPKFVSVSSNDFLPADSLISLDGKGIDTLVTYQAHNGSILQLYSDLDISEVYNHWKAACPIISADKSRYPVMVSTNTAVLLKDIQKVNLTTGKNVYVHVSCPTGTTVIKSNMLYGEVCFNINNV
mgnify:CR=1 FL=1